MSLEDHLGDIIRKAREGAKISIVSAAHATGLSEGDYRVLEDSGKTARKPNLLELANMLDLHGAKLDRIANAAQRVGRNRFIAPLRRQSRMRMCPSNI